VQAVGPTGLATAQFATQVLPLPTDPPDAALSGQFAEAAAPATIQFDATASVAGTGRSIVNSHWDLNNDSLFNDTPEEQALAGLLITTAITLSSPGLNHIQVKVFDDIGESDTAAFDVLLHKVDYGAVATVGSGGSGGGLGPDHCLITLPTGEPAIAYRDSVKQNLMYAVATSGDGTGGADWQIVSLDAQAFDQFNVSTSLAIIGGKPALVYFYDRIASGEKFAYAYSTTALGASAQDWSTCIIDTAPLVGTRCSLAEVNGLPAVAYQDSNFGSEIHVKYARASSLNPTGAGDWGAVTLFSTFNSDFLVSSLAEINGAPTIVYEQLENGDLNYARSATPSGSSPADWTSITLFPRGGSGTFWKSSLLEVSGRPAIAWSDATGLKYSRSALADGLDAADWVTIPINADKAEHTSMALVNGNPAIAYWYNGIDNSLGYAWSNIPTGGPPNFWRSFATHAYPGGILSPTLGFNNGKPVFATMFADPSGSREIRYGVLQD
jgi:hypothetical protein